MCDYMRVTLKYISPSYKTLFPTHFHRIIGKIIGNFKYLHTVSKTIVPINIKSIIVLTL